MLLKYNDRQPSVSPRIRLLTEQNKYLFSVSVNTCTLGHTNNFVDTRVFYALINLLINFSAGAKLLSLIYTNSTCPLSINKLIA